MAAPSSTWLEEPWTVGQAIVYGTLAVGVLDGLAACVMALARGSTPFRLFQAIAYGLLGRETYSGGWPTMLLGLLLHFIVALGVASTYVVVSRFAPDLARRPLLYGPFYGLAVYFFMNLVVIPLSAIGASRLAVSGMLIHLVFVGPPAALAAAKAPLASPLAAGPASSAR